MRRTWGLSFRFASQLARHGRGRGVAVASAGLQQLLTPELIGQFWDYCCEEETVRLYHVNLVAEIGFLDEVGLDQRIATSSVNAVLFLPESPLLEIRADLESFEEVKLARLVQWHFRQRNRKSMGLEPLDEAALDAWLSAGPLSLEVNAPTDCLTDNGDLDELSEEAALLVARHVVANFPDIARYIALTGPNSEALGYRDLRSVGKLDEPAAVMFNARRALLGDAGSKDWRRTLKIAAQIEALVRAGQ